MDHEQKAGPADTAGPAQEQTVNETTAKSTPAAEPAPTGADEAASQQTPAEADAVVADEVVAVEATVEAAEPSAEPEATEAQPEGPDGKAGAEPLAAELAALRSALDERTADLQRLSAEYANYRKRVERDRLAMAEQATAQVVSALLPILDDLDRAREHGDLVGPFGSMAEQLNAALAKFGLTGFGEIGDAFDPTRHEAVTHQTSADVTESTCVAVMRRGYLLGERLLRPALVAVADPESE